MIRSLLIALSLLLLLPFAAPGSADELRKPEVWTDLYGVALKGYDPVAYHLAGEAVLGDPALELEWKGAKWHFANAANRTRFQADPERWAPQYGGYCAWAIVEDRFAPINPEIFKVVDGKLYLNLNMRVHNLWLEKMDSFITQADEKWPDVLVLAD
ncbi:MAG: YHS domain-containing (seleno)protein [Pseudomonadota bacterium]